MPGSEGQRRDGLLTDPVFRLQCAELLSQGDHGFIVLDLSGVSFCDSTGPNVLIGAWRQADASGAVLVLVCAGPLRRILQMWLGRRHLAPPGAAWYHPRTGGRQFNRAPDGLFSLAVPVHQPITGPAAERLAEPNEPGTVEHKHVLTHVHWCRRCVLAGARGVDQMTRHCAPSGFPAIMAGAAPVEPAGDGRLRSHGADTSVAAGPGQGGVIRLRPPFVVPGLPRWPADARRGQSSRGVDGPLRRC
ncbi:STAS domain-containing protein [Streptomyces canus]|uniref:STAS domain-containing protein n=1 Tax=Streptomyces canus TaxID=58343 RepID=UPI0036783D6B